MRPIKECPHRHPAICKAGQPPAVCELLGKITRVREPDLLRVEQNACEACCSSFPPTVDDWNPVVASLVHQLADRVIEQGGTDGCTVSDAAALADAAVANLPIVLPEEDDGVDDIQLARPPEQFSVESLTQILPLPAACSQDVDEPRWAVAVTTAPRRQSTLTTCLDSLIASGWPHPVLFADGHVDVDRKFSHLRQVNRAEPIGAWPAWCEALRTLLNDDPTADSIAVIQDDALFPGIRALRSYIGRFLWPAAEPGIVSLYTCSDDMQATNHWRRYPGVWRLGAVALILSRTVAQNLLASADQGELRFVEGTAGIDTRVGVWADRMNIPVWHPSPSLVQHIGQVSSIWARSRAVGLRRASRFLGNKADL